MKTTKRFDFNFKPLMPSQSITAVSSVPDKQTFDANSGTYTPDYSLTPLTIRANISVIDLDGVIASGEINSKLANIRWYEIINGVETIIASTDSNYIIGAEGSADAGQIQVRRNVDPAMPLTLVFRAEYVDPRTNQIFQFNLSKLIRSYTEAASPRLELDSPAQVIYNPIRHPDKQTIKASFTIAGTEIAAAYRDFIWQILRSGGTWSDVGNSVDGDLDYDVEVSADKTSVTVDRSLMGDSLTLRCIARYDAGGNPSAQPVDASTPVRTVTFTRRIPQFWAEILDAPYNIPQTPYIFPRCEIRDTLAILTDAEANEHFTVDWLMATNKPGNATLSYQKIGSGIRAQLSTSLMSQSIGGVLEADINPRDPWAAWADSDGAVITDADGSIILIR